MTEQIGAKIKEARLAAGMTQKELAEAVGLSAKAISEAERGLKELTDEELKAIAEATGAESLLGEAKEVAAEESEAIVIDEKEVLELISAAPPEAKKAILSVLKGEEDPVSAITGVLGGILGGKKKQPAEEQAVDDREILELLKTAAPEVKEKALSILKGIKG